MTPCDRRLTYLGSDISLTAARRPQEYRRWKGEIYALPPPKDAEPPRVSGSLVAFARNGRPLGAAYRDLYAGEYLPAGSLFTDPDLQAEPAELKFNFGEGTQRRPPLLDFPQHPPCTTSEQRGPAGLPPPERIAAFCCENSSSVRMPDSFRAASSFSFAIASASMIALRLVSWSQNGSRYSCIRMQE